MTRAALRLTDQALAELRGHLTQIAARFAEPDADGTWTRQVLVLADLQDRPGPATPASQPGMSNAARASAQHPQDVSTISMSPQNHLFGAASARNTGRPRQRQNEGGSRTRGAPRTTTARYRLRAGSPLDRRTCRSPHRGRMRSGVRDGLHCARVIASRSLTSPRCRLASRPSASQVTVQLVQQRAAAPTRSQAPVRRLRLVASPAPRAPNLRRLAAGCG
jgi:hypothetical protein